MTVRFRRPSGRTDWAKVLLSLLPAAGPGASLAAAALAAVAPAALAASAVGFAVAAQKAIRDAIEAATPARSIDERAWVWLRAALTVATVDLLDEPGLHAPLDAAEKRRAVRDFLTAALPLDGEGDLDWATLTNPAACPLVAPVRDRLPDLLRAVAPEHGLGDARIRADFDRLLRAAAACVYALDTAYFAPVADAVTGPAAEGARRDVAWARHEDWIRGLYHRQPIFSPDETETVPLSAVYHRLRCVWHVETDRPRDPDAPPRRDGDDRVRVAHVADLHATLHAWLADDRADPVRVVAGGPGSGKSSFSRAFAVEVIDARTHRVVYVPLQHVRLGADLRNLIGASLKERWHAFEPAGGQGFETNPLDWRAHDTLPYLLVFDGLDELSHDDDTARDLARRFVRNVHAMLAGLGAPPVRALILGRSVAIQDALREADLDPRCLIHVAPLTPLNEDDATIGHVSAVEDPGGLAANDERPAFWRRSPAARLAPVETTPEAVTADALLGLNAEPLLLHLLIVSGYAGADWQAAADNRNYVYRRIFEQIEARNRGKLNRPLHGLERDDFLTLLECLGLAAWRGNGRTVAEADFAALRALHPTGAQRGRFERLPATELRNVAIQFHTRRGLDHGGFEFVHKSFAEYLAARGLLAAALRAARLMSDPDEPRSEAGTALGWTELVAAAELSEEVMRFLVDEARLLDAAGRRSALAPLTKLFNWSLVHGMPAHLVDPRADWRTLETMQRCPETALLAALSALARVRDPASGPVVIDVDWGEMGGQYELLNRIHATFGQPARLALSMLVLRGAYLRGADLSGADLSEASLRGAVLSGANLSDLGLAAASLRFVDCKDSLNLSAAAVQSAFGVQSGIGRTRLPDGLPYPEHWHRAAKQAEDSPKAARAYDHAYRAWRGGLDGAVEADVAPRVNP